jgi:nucleotide-binding universal stress UspA family protein
MLSLSKILIPVAFSDPCRGVVRQAAALACRVHSELTLLHVAQPMHYSLGAWEATVPMPDPPPGRMAGLQQQLDSFFAAELETIRARTILAEGDAATEITGIAEREGTNLIMMPTHGRGSFRRLLLGSVTAKVLHDALCPVWTGVHMQDALVQDRLTYRKIVCAVDLGPQTQAALGWAGAFAQAWGADLTVIHALAPATGAANPALQEEFGRSAGEQIAQYLRELGVAARTRITSGALPEAVCEEAKDLEADLLVIGRGHGTGGGRLPSNAYAIIRQSVSPVVSV